MMIKLFLNYIDRAVELVIKTKSSISNSNVLSAQNKLCLGHNQQINFNSHRSLDDEESEIDDVKECVV